MDTIFHINDSTKWSMVFSNVSHMHEWMVANSDNGKIEVLVNGPAVSDVVAGSEVNLATLTDIGVTVAVCNNSMVQRHIETSSLQSKLTVVPVGVVELAAKQHAGFAYIKP